MQGSQIIATFRISQNLSAIREAYNFTELKKNILVSKNIFNFQRFQPTDIVFIIDNGVEFHQKFKSDDIIAQLKRLVMTSLFL